MSTRQENPLHAEMTPLRIGGSLPFDFRHPKHGDFSPAFVEAIDAEKLACYLLTESWHPSAEIVPNYVDQWAREGTRPEVQIRVPIHSNNPHHEEDSYSYLRYSKGPKQGFFWDVYGDDFGSVELAILALHQAPSPTYCGPMVFKLPLRPAEPQ